MNHSKYNSKLDPKQQKSDADSAVTAVPAASARGNVTPIRAEADAELKHKDTAARQGPSSPVITQTTGDATADMVMTRQDDEHAASKLAHAEASGKPAVAEKAALTSLPHVSVSQETSPAVSAKAAD